MRVSGKRDQRIAAIAELQRGRVARRQLLAAGVSRNMIHTMLHTGPLVARHRGVYAFGHAAPGELTRETEALLAIRVPAFLRAGFSLALWSLAPPPHPSEPVEITLLAAHAIWHPGIRAHRSSTLDAPDTGIHRGLPTTSPARDLVDVAGTTSEFRLERMLDDALHRNLVRLSQLRDALDRAGPTHKGVGILRAILADRAHSSGTSRSKEPFAVIATIAGALARAG